MPPEEDLPVEVSEASSESGGESTEAALSVSSQEKPQDLSDKEQQRTEMRKLGMTPSSTDLPKIDLSFDDYGKVVAKVADKSYTIDPRDQVVPPRPDDVDPGYAPDGPKRGDVPPTQGSEVPQETPPESGEMGRAGDRSRDSGLGKPTHSEVTTDGQGRVTGYKMPDGTKYEIKYGEDGSAAEPTSVTVTPEKSPPMTFEKNSKGDWRNPQDPNMGLDYVSFDKDSKQITIRGGGTDTKINPDGSFEEKNWTSGQVQQKIDADGTAHAYDHAKGTETVTKPDSHISEVKDINGGAVKGYELRDEQGHVTKVELNDDDSATVTRGDLVISYDKVERTASGDLKFTNKDKTSVEMRQDGTEIHRDKSDKITRMINSDGETTEFKRGAGGKVTGLTVTDAQGKVVETRNKGIEVDDTTGDYKVKLDKAEAEARKADGEEGTAETLERKADGTERLLAKDGTQVKSDADQLLEKFKNYTPEQQKQLRQDLADIDKLQPAERREAVYKSLDKIARNDEHPGDKIRLTGQQARELVQSLAHQVAHPESIQQGDKMTCVLANAEQSMARNHPEQYADMVAKLATEGKYTTHDGKTIEAQTGPEGTSLAGKSDWYGQRSYTSELFQNGVANLGLPAGAKYESYPPGHPALNPRPEGVDPSSDTGERVKYPDGRVTRFEGLDSQKQAEVLNHLVKDGKYGQQAINNPEDLANALKKNGGPPLNVGIALGGDHAQTGMGSGEGAAISGYHAVNITHFDKGPPATVYYENPAGGTDHSYPNGKGVPAEDFIKAMHAGKTEMKAVVKGAEGAAAPGGKMGNPTDAQAPAKGDAQAGKMGNPITLDTVEVVGDPKAPDVPGAEYRGEGVIKREVFGSQRTLKEGETFEDVAKKQLGDQPPPTQGEIDAYVKEIRQLNNVHEASQVRKDQEVILPGHNANGDLVIEGNDGMRTVTKDGVVKVEHYRDGTSYEMTPLPNGGHEFHHKGKKPGETYDYTHAPDGKGGYTEKHTGPRPEDNYEITKSPDGHYKIKDAKGERAADSYDESHPDPRIEKAKMLEAVNKSMPDDQRARFYENMERFEARARQQKLSPEEQAKFYHEVARIADAKDSGNANLPDGFERHKLVEQVMENAADPKGIDQGLHGTCGAAALETRMYTNNPSAAAKLIADVSTTGEFKGTKPDASLLEPDAEAQYTVTPDGKRNYASQVFQGTAISMVPNGEGYKQGPADESAKPPKTGESVKKGEFTGVTAEEVQQMEQRITGKSQPVIENTKVLLDGKIEKVDDKQVHVGSEQELRQQLLKMKTANPSQLPAVILVHTKNEPFFSDSGGGKAGGSGGYHFVTVTDYNPGTGKVTLDNQWGKTNDHRDLPVGDLYHATQAPSPERIKEMEAEVKRNQETHKENPVLEMELLRLKRDAGQIDQDTFNKEVTSVMKHQMERWKNDPENKKIPFDQRKILYQSYDALLYSLPESEKAKVKSGVGPVDVPVDETVITM